MAASHPGPAMTLFRRTACLIAALLAADAFAAADDWHALNHQARAQAKAGDEAGLHDTLQRLAPALPGSPTIVYNLGASAARLGHPDEAIAALTRLQEAGLA
jgi:hypothetical protein